MQRITSKEYLPGQTELEFWLMSSTSSVKALRVPATRSSSRREIQATGHLRGYLHLPSSHWLRLACTKPLVGLAHYNRRKSLLGVVAHFIPAFERQRQVDCCGLGANLIYIVSSMPVKIFLANKKESFLLMLSKVSKPHIY